MIESMLEPHLKRKAGASQTDVGMTFLILGGVYMITSVIVGLVSILSFIRKKQKHSYSWTFFVTEKLNQQFHF